MERPFPALSSLEKRAMTAPAQPPLEWYKRDSSAKLKVGAGEKLLKEEE